MIPPRAKVTGIYINSALATTEAKENGYDEAILLNADGTVSEGAGENIFLVRNGQLITPGPEQNILEGITRDAVITLAREELGLTVVERAVSRSELYVADELFFTGTAAQVSAVGEVDGRMIGDGKIGPITAKLQKLFFDVVRARNPKYAHWCTAVYPVGTKAKATVR
jgi:branched-chain amino acid aminotransferase